MRLPPTTPLVVSSLALSLLLAILAGGATAPQVPVAEAARFEGQGDVRIQGLAVGLRSHPGRWEGNLHANGSTIVLRGRGEPGFANGAWVEAEGRVARSSGRLALLTERVEVRAIPAPMQASWDAVAQNPQDWQHQPLRLAGWVERGEFRDHDGHAIQLAPGPWPRGATNLTGYLAYTPACVCHRWYPLVEAP